MAAEDGETQNVLQELSEDLGFQEDDGAEGEVAGIIEYLAGLTM